MANTLADYLHEKEYGLKADERSLLDELRVSGNILTRWIKKRKNKDTLDILQQIYPLEFEPREPADDFTIYYDAIQVNGDIRKLNWIRSYLIHLHNDRSTNELYSINFLYLDYKKLMDSEGITYAYKTFSDINRNLEKLKSLISGDDSVYKSFAPEGEIGSRLDRVEHFAEILEKLTLSISLKPGKVIKKYFNADDFDVYKLLVWLNGELREWYGTFRYDEPEKKGLLADPNKRNNPKYIGQIIKKVDDHLSKIFANAGERDRNNSQIGEKSKNS